MMRGALHLVVCDARKVCTQLQQVRIRSARLGLRTLRSPAPLKRLSGAAGGSVKAPLAAGSVSGDRALASGPPASSSCCRLRAVDSRQPAGDPAAKGRMLLAYSSAWRSMQLNKLECIRVTLVRLAAAEEVFMAARRADGAYLARCTTTVSVSQPGIKC